MSARYDPQHDTQRQISNVRHAARQVGPSLASSAQTLSIGEQAPARAGAELAHQTTPADKLDKVCQALKPSGKRQTRVEHRREQRKGGAEDLGRQLRRRSEQRARQRRCQVERERVAGVRAKEDGLFEPTLELARVGILAGTLGVARAERSDRHAGEAARLHDDADFTSCATDGTDAKEGVASRVFEEELLLERFACRERDEEERRWQNQKRLLRSGQRNEGRRRQGTRVKVLAEGKGGSRQRAALQTMCLVVSYARSESSFR